MCRSGHALVAARGRRRRGRGQAVFAPGVFAFVPVALKQSVRFEVVESGVEECLGELAGGAMFRPEPPPDLESGQMLAAQRANDGVIDP